MPLDVIHKLAWVKWAAARVNADLQLLDTTKALAIAEAAQRAKTGEFDVEFPLSEWQTGPGTQSNMSVNEGKASLASLSLGGGRGSELSVHPIDDVNLGQPSNDLFPTAKHMAAALHTQQSLLPALRGLQDALSAKATQFSGVVKFGRTHWQDATPVTRGQGFGGYAAQLALCAHSIQQALEAVHALAIGGTAAGTGLKTHPEFGPRVVSQLAEKLGFPWVQANNLFAAMAGHEALEALHGSIKMLAIALTKIANDIRLMGRSPRAALGELVLPQNKPGSSIVPGKVNPTQVEALTMVCAQVWVTMRRSSLPPAKASLSRTCASP